MKKTFRKILKFYKNFYLTKFCFTLEIVLYLIKLRKWLANLLDKLVSNISTCKNTMKVQALSMVIVKTNIEISNLYIF